MDTSILDKAIVFAVNAHRGKERRGKGFPYIVHPMEAVAIASNDVKIVALADKLSNIRAIYRDYQAIGDKVWDLFSVKDAAAHQWHFQGLARALKSLDATFAYKEFVETIDKVFLSFSTMQK